MNAVSIDEEFSDLDGKIPLSESLGIRPYYGSDLMENPRVSEQRRALGCHANRILTGSVIYAEQKKNDRNVP